MAKPSIFSKDYKKRMRQRRRRISIITVIILILGGAIVLFGKNNSKFNMNEITTKINSIFNKKTLKDNDKKAVIPPPKSNPIVDDQKDEKEYPVKLADGTQLKAIYEEKNNLIVLKSLNTVEDSDSSKFKYDISPDTTKMVVYDIKAQSILYLASDGTVKDITNKAYVAESTGTRFDKETVLSNTPTYVWASSPRFIDNENIAYISQLPWFNKENMKYLWMVDINNPDNHRLFENIQGVNISFDKLTDKGLTTIINGTSKYLNVNGQLND